MQERRSERGIARLARFTALGSGLFLLFLALAAAINGLAGLPSAVLFALAGLLAVPGTRGRFLAAVTRATGVDTDAVGRWTLAGLVVLGFLAGVLLLPDEPDDTDAGDAGVSTGTPTPSSATGTPTAATKVAVPVTDAGTGAAFESTGAGVG